MLTVLYVALLSLGLTTSAAMSADDSALPSEPQAQSPASESVQPQVDQEAADKAEEKRKTILADATVAIEETKKARTQLEMAELLGYGNKDVYKPMHEQLDEIEQKTKGGKGGKGWFDKIKQQISELL
jgi:hypothetical protein